MRRIAFLLCFAFVTAIPASAQLDEINRIIAGGVDDAELLLTRYMKPLSAGFGAALGTGWTHSARPHSLLGFHVSVQAGAAMVPSGDQSFSVTQAELQTMELLNPGIGSTPTAAGSGSAEVYHFRAGGGFGTTTFTMPQGAGLSIVPVPVLQAGVGIGGGTSVMLRAVPSISLGSYGSVNSWGLAAQHGLNQWIPGGALLPLHFSVQLGYSSLGLSTEFATSGSSDQELNWNTHTYSAALLAGRSLAVLSVYGGVGIERSTSSLKMEGTYQVSTPGGLQSIENPIDTSVPGENLLRSFIGVRVNLAVIGIRGEYTLAEYPSFNAGVSISLR